MRSGGFPAKRGSPPVTQLAGNGSDPNRIRVISFRLDRVGFWVWVGLECEVKWVGIVGRVSGSGLLSWFIMSVYAGRVRVWALTDGSVI